MPCEDGVDSRPLWRWTVVARPIIGAEHLQHGRGHRGALAPRDPGDIDGACQLESFDRHSHQGRGHSQTSRRDRHAEFRFEQRDEVLLRRDLAATLDINS